MPIGRTHNTPDHVGKMRERLEREWAALPEALEERAPLIAGVFAERDLYRAIIEQFLDETPTYEDMFVSDLRDRVGDFRQAASDALSRTRNTMEDS